MAAAGAAPTGLSDQRHTHNTEEPPQSGRLLFRVAMFAHLAQCGRFRIARFSYGRAPWP